MQEEFYQVATRKKVYTSLEELQSDLDEWLAWYNRERSHSGKRCEGRTPLQTFRETKHLVYQKMLDKQLEQKGSAIDEDSITAISTVS